MADVTHVLSRLETGDPSAADELLSLVYDEAERGEVDACVDRFQAQSIWEITG